jgi:hypothetical protein
MKVLFFRLVFVQLKLFARLWFGGIFKFDGMKLARPLCFSVEIDASIHFSEKAITP